MNKQIENLTNPLTRVAQNIAFLRRESAAVRPFHAEASARLTRLAQLLESPQMPQESFPPQGASMGATPPSMESSMDAAPGKYDFDPSQEEQPQVMQMKDEKRLHPGIESFVTDSGKDGEETIDTRQTHNAQVTFRAPKDIALGDIMAYIVNIKKALGVDVEGFRWTVQDAKKSARE